MSTIEVDFDTVADAQRPNERRHATNQTIDRWLAPLRASKASRLLGAYGRTLSLDFGPRFTACMPLGAPHLSSPKMGCMQRDHGCYEVAKLSLPVPPCNTKPN